MEGRSAEMNQVNRQKILVFAAVAVVALFAADKIVFTPLTNAWKDRSDEIRKLRSNVESGRSLQRRELGLRGHWEEMKSNALPENPSLTEQQVLNAFNRWAQDSRVSITSVTPQWKHDSDDYTTLQCRVEASGNLGYITRFLYEIEKDPMALRLDTMEISSRDNDGQQLALAIQASALVLPHPLPRQ